MCTYNIRKINGLYATPDGKQRHPTYLVCCTVQYLHLQVNGGEPLRDLQGLLQQLRGNRGPVPVVPRPLRDHGGTACVVLEPVRWNLLPTIGAGSGGRVCVLC
jgi:hypothetical protein